MNADAVDPPGRGEDIYQEMPVLSCEIEELGSDSKGNEPNNSASPAGEEDMEPPASWPIFENISNGYFLENMDTTDGGGASEAETVDQSEDENDGSAPAPPANGDPLMHPLILAHNGRIFNSKNLTFEEKNKYALEGNPSFRYRKLYSNGQKAYKCW